MFFRTCKTFVSSFVCAAVILSQVIRPCDGGQNSEDKDDGIFDPDNNDSDITHPFHQKLRPSSFHRGKITTTSFEQVGASQNELRQLQSTETVILLNPGKVALSRARVSHEQPHLWKLTLDTSEERRLKTGTGETDFFETTTDLSPQSVVSDPDDVQRDGESSLHHDVGMRENLPSIKRNIIMRNAHAQNGLTKQGKRESANGGVVNNRINKIPPGCRSCMLNSELEAALPPQIMRQMRLEVIKEQILRKLGLTEPPNTTHLPKEAIPLPVAQGSTVPRHHHPYLRQRDKNVDDFYGKTEQVIIFPEDAIPQCVTDRADPASCFTFKLPHENLMEEISTAELWVYKLPDPGDGQNQSFWLDEISPPSTADFAPSQTLAENIDIVTNVVMREGWIKLNLSRVMPEWMKSNKSSLSIQVGCQTCAVHPSVSPVDTSGDQRPFIAINFKNSARKKRSRRSLNCSPSLSECCRESFVVSFREIGWHTWIIGPEQYDAYFCKGSCMLNGIAHSSAKHTTVMQKYIRTFGITNRTAEIIPCCTASKMSSISLIYRDPHNLNNTVKKEILPNMVVDSCGCL